MPLPSPTQTPTLVELIQGIVDQALAQTRTAEPGVVQAYDPVTQTVTVQPQIQDGYFDADRQRQTTTKPPVPGCPVLFRGDQTNWETHPIAIGATGLIVYCSASIEQWQHSAHGAVVDPKDDRHHHLSDAIFIPGVRSVRGAIQGSEIDPTAWIINAVTMIVKAQLIQLGSAAAADPVVRQSDLQAVVDKMNHFIDTFNGHGHEVVVSGFALGGGSGSFESTKPASPAGGPVPDPAPPLLFLPITEDAADDATGSPVVKAD